MYDQATKDEAVRLRKVEQLSLKKIAGRIGVSKSTVSIWLKIHPLKKRLLKKRMRQGGGDKRSQKNLRNCDPSFLSTLVSGKLPVHQKSKVAEAAVVLRLLLQGCSVYSSVFDGDKYDCVVSTSKGRLLKVQVKSTGVAKYGNPRINVRCSNGRGQHRLYRKEEVDILVAYDLYLDRAYVYTFSELNRYKGMIVVSPEAEERWDKLEA